MISGYERNVNEARAAIEQLVAALQDMVSEDIRLDRRVHARIIGARGKAIRKLMEEFKVRTLCIFANSDKTKLTSKLVMLFNIIMMMMIYYNYYIYY